MVQSVTCGSVFDIKRMGEEGGGRGSELVSGYLWGWEGWFVLLLLFLASGGTLCCF